MDYMEPTSSFFTGCGLNKVELAHGGVSEEVKPLRTQTDHARVIHEDKHKGMSAWVSLLHSNMLPIYGREACRLLLYAIPGEKRKDNNRRTFAGGIAV